MRKIIATYIIIIPAQEDALIPVNFANLPALMEKSIKQREKCEEKAQPFHIKSIHFSVIDAIFDRFTPKLAKCNNLNLWPIIITKNTKIAIIYDYSALFEAIFAQLLNQGDYKYYWTNNMIFSRQSDIFDYINDRKYSTKDKQFESYFAEKYANAPFIKNNPDHKGMPKITPSYGIFRPSSVKFVKTKAGVIIAYENPAFAEKLAKIVDSFDIFRDKSVVFMPEEYKLRMDLINGWQNQLKSVKKYPLGAKDRDFLDKLHNELHGQRKMGFENESAAIACLIFVVWRIMNDIEKGRIIADLRPLNQFVVLNVYFLPD